MFESGPVLNTTVSFVHFTLQRCGAERVFVPPIVAASHIQSALSAKCNGFGVQSPVLKPILCFVARE